MPQAKHAYTLARKPRLPASLTPQTRKLVDDAMSAHWRALEGLIAFLDAADGDVDLEPSLGDHPCGRPLSLIDCEGGDVQDEPHDEQAEGNSEPSLAHTLDMNQDAARRHLSSVNSKALGAWFQQDEDREAEHDGREPCCEDEGAQCEDEGAEHDGREPDEATSAYT